MFGDFADTYYDLQDYAMPYYEHYSTALSPYKAGLVSGYERCCAFVTSDEFRKNLNIALTTVALATFLGAHVFSPLVVVPAVATSMAKVYLLSQGLDYLGTYLAEQAAIMKESDPDQAASYELYSGFIKSVSDTVLISGMASTFAAPIVGALSHVQFQLAYNILVPTTQAIIRTIGFELSKAKAVAFEREVKGDETSEYLIKAVLIGAGYKVLSSMLGSSLVADLVAFVASRSFVTAFMAANKDIYQVPKHLWSGLNSSIGFCAQYFLLGFSEKLVVGFCESSTSLSAVFMRSVGMSVIVEKFTGQIKEFTKEPVAQIKAYYEGSIDISYKDIESKASEIMGQVYGEVFTAAEKTVGQAAEFASAPAVHLNAYYAGLQERVEVYYKDMAPKAAELINAIYGHASRAAEQAAKRVESALTRQP